jgi:hypothetical protein
MSVPHLLGGDAFRSVFTLVQAAHLTNNRASRSLFLWIVTHLPSRVFSSFGKPLGFLRLFNSRPCLELILGAFRPPKNFSKYRNA